MAVVSGGRLVLVAVVKSALQVLVGTRAPGTSPFNLWAVQRTSLLLPVGEHVSKSVCEHISELGSKQASQSVSE